MMTKTFHLRLFIAGDEPNSHRAQENLVHLCNDFLHNDCEIETVDILKDYQSALSANIYVTPALKVEEPKPPITIYGNLNDERKVLSALGVQG
jgi:circadian clock protein KaiB